MAADVSAQPAPARLFDIKPPAGTDNVPSAADTAAQPAPPRLFDLKPPADTGNGPPAASGGLFGFLNAGNGPRQPTSAGLGNISTGAGDDTTSASPFPSQSGFKFSNFVTSGGTTTSAGAVPGQIGSDPSGAGGNTSSASTIPRQAPASLFGPFAPFRFTGSGGGKSSAGPFTPAKPTGAGGDTTSTSLVTIPERPKDAKGDTASSSTAASQNAFGSLGADAGSSSSSTEFRGFSQGSSSNSTEFRGFSQHPPSPKTKNPVLFPDAKPAPAPLSSASADQNAPSIFGTPKSTFTGAAENQSSTRALVEIPDSRPASGGPGSPEGTGTAENQSSPRPSTDKVPSPKPAQVPQSSTAPGGFGISKAAEVAEEQPSPRPLFGASLFKPVQAPQSSTQPLFGTRPQSSTQPSGTKPQSSTQPLFGAKSQSSTQADAPSKKTKTDGEVDKRRPRGTQLGAGAAKLPSDPSVLNDDPRLFDHLAALRPSPINADLEELKSTPLFTHAVRKYAESLNISKKPPFSQYALLAGHVEQQNSAVAPRPEVEDPRIFYNVSAPSSVFICGSQGSGKSHTLSCLLESCLIPSQFSVLPRPLTGIVFHYDTFISDASGEPCEAAYLSSSPFVKVRVLCAPTNVRNIKKTYSRLPNVKVEELKLNESDLNTKRMMDLMAVGESSMPLYMHVIQRILRELRLEQQATGGSFDYIKFRSRIAGANLTPMQLGPLDQRLDTLESFMVKEQVQTYTVGSQRYKSKGFTKGTDWTPRAGELIIVDLSCPCVTAEMACSLFNICLSLFLEQEHAGGAAKPVGRVIALDEAHKYMGESAECATLTRSLLATIRLQRHLGARILVSTQEPTISPKLLDLCSVTVVHRFTSPDWLRVLKGHLAGISTSSRIAAKLKRAEQVWGDEGDDDGTDAVTDGLAALALTSDDPTLELFSRIVALKVGEALVFAPSAVVALERKPTAAAATAAAVPSVFGAKQQMKRLGHDVLKVRVRSRLTLDGGKSVMAD